jgi:hypothetical protein
MIYRRRRTLADFFVSSAALPRWSRSNGTSSEAASAAWLKVSTKSASAGLGKRGLSSVRGFGGARHTIASVFVCRRTTRSSMHFGVPTMAQRAKRIQRDSVTWVHPVGRMPRHPGVASATSCSARTNSHSHVDIAQCFGTMRGHSSIEGQASARPDSRNSAARSIVRLRP